jgi:hypothetical protein
LNHNSAPDGIPFPDSVSSDTALDRLTSLGIAVWLLGVQAAWIVFLAWVGLRLLKFAG